MKKFFYKSFLFLLLLSVLLVGSFFVLDYFFPLSISQNKTTQTVVAQDETPLWRFADEKGIWRYSVSLDEVPDYYLDVLLNYEDRYFYNHIGINPMSLFRAAWQNISNNKIISDRKSVV